MLDREKKKKTIYQEMTGSGMSRRQFLKLCATIAAVLGLDFSQTDRVVQAMEREEKLPFIWLHYQDCTGCSESFIRSSHPTAGDLLLNYISLNYHENLTAAAGEATERAKKETMEKYKGKYILAVEGSIPRDEFFIAGGRTAAEQVREAAANAGAIVAIGSCATHGGIAAAHPNPTGAMRLQDVIPDKTVIQVPGCPPISEVMAGVVVHYITFGTLPELDHRGRPKAFYSQRIHDTCNRRAYFDAGLFVESFDDENAKNGYCLYKVGCKGPTTYNSCAQLRWNGGISFPIQSGNPCIGCSEENFWDNGPFFTRQAHLPGLSKPLNPDQVGAIAVGAAVAGVAVHATATAISKKRTNNTVDREEKKGENMHV
ncbi:hydrogenase small subunit [Aneurinibacillus terranovensis]|uniref:hydrogenase small subunit n=1 Tax=Aneurinibacillus terranovensis TaxID=278991 RepID=UPI0024805DE1|nr:hydrogenase small subunit [Aneurinibacillus terranovensis]